MSQLLRVSYYVTLVVAGELLCHITIHRIGLPNSNATSGACELTNIKLKSRVPDQNGVSQA